MQAQQSSTIVTSPSLPDNRLATGYESLQLTIQFQQGLYEECSWQYESSRIILLSPGSPCISEDRSSYTLDCNIADNVITTTLTILSAAVISVSVHVECQGDLVDPSTIIMLDSLHLNVTGTV